MKTLFIICAICLVNFGFSQNTKKDTTTTNETVDFGTRIYDTRIVRYMSMDTVKSNPYTFADTTNSKQLADKPKKTIKDNN